VRRTLAVVAVATAVLAASTGCGSSPASAPQASAPPATAPPATIAADGTVDWQGCGDGMRCATLAVPVDGDDPASPTLDLAVAMRPATTGDRIGVLVVNPGGPGVTAVDWLGRARSLDGLNRNFDLVAWDPRGVGRSTPLDCGTAVSVNDAVADPAAVAAACTATSPALATNLGTDETVRDLEAIRTALGETTISFLGLSYGTFIALAYARAHPDRLRALVLDGPVNPADSLAELLEAQAVAMEAVVVSVGANADGTNLYDQVAATAAVDPTTLGFAGIAATYDPASHRLLRQALVAALGGDPSGLARLAASYTSAVSAPAYLATLCTDTDRPADPAAHDAMARRLAAVAPRLGPTVAGEVAACAWWPGGPGERWDPTVAGGPPVLVVAATGDAATPLAVAQAVDAAITDSVLVVNVADNHTSMSSSQCVRDVVAAYLATVTLPAAGTQCGA
jgi:pimeloyl-ACP methyl ester carboxylesterase